MGQLRELWLAYRLRLRRKRYLIRAWRKSRDLRCVSDKTSNIAPGAVLCFATMRNEALRVPFFLAHHRALGVGHFIVVVNAATDHTLAMLSAEPDVSVWTTQASYKAARFGVDWLTWLQHRYARGHWALTLDGDEALVYPDCDTRPLSALTAWLDSRGARGLGAMMLDLYPDGPIGGSRYTPGTPVWDTLTHFDADGYTWERQRKFRNISIRGGPRRRVFFAQSPERSPHLHKIPLVRWRRGMVYASSTHLLLPRSHNAAFDARRGLPTGALLHSKFLPDVTQKSREEKLRAEHFTHPEHYGTYYDALAEGPNLMGPGSTRYTGPAQLEALGIMARGGW
ncbi:MAG: glycosyltransferase family 2 protein [Pseudomonadota bacterium]